MARMDDDTLRSITDQEMREKLTAPQLREAVSYDAATGTFVRLKRTSRQLAGEVAGNRRSDGYIKFRVGGIEYFAHRLAWLHFYGEWPSKHIDHIDGNPSNNAISNLRLASDGENAQNQWRASKKNKAGLLGVSFHKCGYWRARIAVNKKSKTIGYFKTAAQAYEAYLKAKREFHPFGELARA